MKKKVLLFVLIVCLIGGGLFFFTKRSNKLDDRYVYADISTIKIGMTRDEVLKILPDDSYTDCFGAGFYVNDRKSGHLYNVKFSLTTPMSVISITDTGVDVTYIATEDKLSLLKKGMTFDELVQILGRPWGMRTFGVITMEWKINDFDHTVWLGFENGNMVFPGFPENVEP